MPDATTVKLPTTLARRIRSARVQRGLKQFELAERAGISQGHLSQIEAGKRPTLATMKKLRDALQLTDLEFQSWVDAA